MGKQPTGRIETTDGVRRLVITREFRAPIEDVWASVTESARLARWIGDPASGGMQFAMTAESDEATADDMEIRECTAPTRLAVTSKVGDERWQLELDLVEHGGVTTRDYYPAMAEHYRT